MSYSNHNDSRLMEPNSVSLGMFASVGFHAVLFVLMAFFPASSEETVKKPLRIVNLLPPSQPDSTSIQSQAKTSTLEDILQNPLPDLSAGFPPVGNADASSIQEAPNTSSYLGGNSNYNNRVNTSGIKTTDIPTRSFTPKPSTQDSTKSAASPSTASSPNVQPPSSIAPAPSTPVRQFGPPSNSSVPPSLIGAVPEPNGGNIPRIFPDSGPSELNSPAAKSKKIPPSQQTFIPIISTTVPYRYPEAACPKALQGTATLSYYRQSDGTYVAGSGQFDNKSGSQLLDDAALDAVMNSSAPGTGAYQRYSSRFDFVYSDEVCSKGVNASTTPNSTPGSTPSSSPENPSLKPEGEAGDSSKPSASKDDPKPEEKQPSLKGNTSDPSTDKTPDGPVQDSASPSGIVEPDANGDKPKASDKTTPNKVTPPSNPEPTTPSNSAPAPNESVTPSPAPVTPSPEPVKPSPAPVTPNPVPAKPEPVPVPAAPPTSETKPEGDAADLVPLKPVSPAPAAPVPEPEPQLNLELPATDSTKESN